MQRKRLHWTPSFVWCLTHFDVMNCSDMNHLQCDRQTDGQFWRITTRAKNRRVSQWMTTDINKIKRVDNTLDIWRIPVASENWEPYWNRRAYHTWSGRCHRQRCRLLQSEQLLHHEWSKNDVRAQCDSEAHETVSLFASRWMLWPRRQLAPLRGLPSPQSSWLQTRSHPCDHRPLLQQPLTTVSTAFTVHGNWRKIKPIRVHAPHTAHRLTLSAQWCQVKWLHFKVFRAILV